jgi:hypothetical protein
VVPPKINPILIPANLFICQVARVERLNLHILNIDNDKLLESYNYVSPARLPIRTLKDLKEKRLNHYLKGLDYYFYNMNIDDIFPESCLVYSCRDIIKSNNSLISNKKESACDRSKC